jgi:hypothetical protein
MARVTQEGVERIIDAVGKPLKLGKDEFWAELKWLAQVYQRGLKPPSEKEVARRLATIRKAAEQINIALSDDAGAIAAGRMVGAREWFLSAKHLSPNEYKDQVVDAYPEHPGRTMRRMIEDIDQVFNPPPWLPPPPPPPPPNANLDFNRLQHFLYHECSPFERCVGYDLSNLFAQFFDLKAGYTAKDGWVDGPYIRFAEAVLVELELLNQGVPYSRQGIADAMTHVRKGAGLKGHRQRQPTAKRRNRMRR